MRVVPIDARCAWRECMPGVVQIKARCAGVGACRCGRHMRLPTRTAQTGAPNISFQPNASREIVAILKSFCAARSRRLNSNVGRVSCRSRLVLEPSFLVVTCSNAVPLRRNESSVG